jgi:hypothetical protein
MAADTPEGGDRPAGTGRTGSESLADVLASIRAVVSAETESRVTGDGETVLMLTPEMRLDGSSGLAEGLDDAPGDDSEPAPILDEETLRGLINQIVREELQGELGDRIGRNLRKMIRREIVQILDERRDTDRDA